MSQALGLDHEPPDLIGHGSFAITTVLQEMNRPGCEPHGVGAEYALVKAATDLPINWTQDGTEVLLGQQRCQGGNSRIVFA